MKIPFRSLSENTRRYLKELSEMVAAESNIDVPLPTRYHTYYECMTDLAESLNKTIKSDASDELKMLQTIQIYATMNDLYSSFFDDLNEQYEGVIAEKFIEDQTLLRLLRH